MVAPGPAGVPELREPRLDVERMRAALAHAVGTHDFTGFARPGEQRGTVRTVTRADVVSASWAPLHALVFEGHGFLRAMIRNLAGSAVTVGLGLAPPPVLRDLLVARGRYRGVRAPGWGSRSPRSSIRAAPATAARYSSMNTPNTGARAL
jgi:tRNA pseudouridine38-40 synthase